MVWAPPDQILDLPLQSAMIGVAMLKCHRFVRSLWASYRGGGGRSDSCFVLHSCFVLQFLLMFLIFISFISFSVMFCAINTIKVQIITKNMKCVHVLCYMQYKTSFTCACIYQPPTMFWSDCRIRDHTPEPVHTKCRKSTNFA